MTATVTTHTLTPWTLTREQHDTLGDAPRLFVRAEAGLTKPRIVDLDERDEANAEFIVRACNAHDDLLAAAKAAFVALPMTKHNEPINAALKAAIAKAGGAR